MELNSNVKADLSRRNPLIVRGVGRRGFEPLKAEPADLQSAPFDRFGTCPVVLLCRWLLG